jgi:hypothetical protein
MFVAGLGLVACATTAPVGTSPGKPQATAESRRADLYPRVSHFVDQISALEPSSLGPQLEFPTTGWLITWHANVCPRLIGLSEQERDVILARIYEIARLAGVPMDGGHCSPNLNIFVTGHPKELLKEMEKHDSVDMFGVGRGDFPDLIDQFIDKPRPVRVWYNIYSILALDRVLMIVDQTRLQGVSSGQLADYIAMASFAEIKPLAETRPNASLGDAPTILKLFDSSPDAAPAGLSDWDQAYLKTLYRNGRAIQWKREYGVSSSQFTLRMVSDITR